MAALPTCVHGKLPGQCTECWEHLLPTPKGRPNAPPLVSPEWPTGPMPTTAKTERRKRQPPYREPLARMVWNVSATRKRDADGELRNLFYGFMREKLPMGVDTPEGFYHNEPVHSTLEERYYGNRGMTVPKRGRKPNHLKKKP
jgi:hypothetical protein